MRLPRMHIFVGFFVFFFRICKMKRHKKDKAKKKKRNGEKIQKVWKYYRRVRQWLAMCCDGFQTVSLMAFDGGIGNTGHQGTK